MRKKKSTISSSYCQSIIKTSEVNIKDNKLKNKIKKAVKIEIKELKYHFKVDKWPLNANNINDRILYSVFKIHLTDYISALVLQELGKNYCIRYKEKGVTGFYEKE